MSCNMANTEYRDTFTHCQLAANADKLGGRDNAMIAANAIEDGDIRTLRETTIEHPDAHNLIERIVNVSAKYR